MMSFNDKQALGKQAEGYIATCRAIAKVDVIVPVHNAESTIVETITSALTQRFPSNIEHLYQLDDDELQYYYSFDMDLTICCHDDGSTDNSLDLLYELQRELVVRPQQQRQGCKGVESSTTTNSISSTNNIVNVKLLISSSPKSLGAGFARNQAAKLNQGDYLAMLDSDDMMLPTKIVEQVAYMLFRLSQETRRRTLLGCNFQRDPPDSTWHYAQWANSLTERRRMLERFREVTIIQPTWMITRERFEALGGYIGSTESSMLEIMSRHAMEQPQQNPSIVTNERGVYLLVSKHDTMSTLRLAEDLRFFHAHLAFNYNYNTQVRDDNPLTNNYYPSIVFGDGLLKMVGDPIAQSTAATANNNDTTPQAGCYGDPSEETATKQNPSFRNSSNIIKPLLIYRHVPGCTQSARTSRKLLLQLRVKAFEDLVIRPNKLWREAFAIWGAGRDGKEFFKSLSPDVQVKVKCFVDVDRKKIERGFYMNKDLDVKIPIVHFSVLSRNDTGHQNSSTWVEHYSHINKKKCTTTSKDMEKVLNVARSEANEEFAKLPVVVCVAMYRTNGALEQNCNTVGRQEGVDLWHFS